MLKTLDPLTSKVFSFKELSFQIRSWNHTTLTLAIPFIPVSSNEVVNPIANKGWNNQENYRKIYRKAQAAGNLQCCSRLEENMMLVVKQDNGIGFFGVNVELCDQALTKIRLNCREHKPVCLIPFDDVVDRTVAKVAQTVEKNELLIFREVNHFSFLPARVVPNLH